MPLINSKVKLKLKWTKYCVQSTAGADNNNDNSNNIIFTVKDTKLFVLIVTLSAKYNQKLQPKLLSKGFEKSVYWNEYKTKSENKNEIQIYEYRQELTDYLFWCIQIKTPMLKDLKTLYYLPTSYYQKF